MPTKAYKIVLPLKMGIFYLCDDKFTVALARPVKMRKILYIKLTSF